MRGEGGREDADACLITIVLFFINIIPSCYKGSLPDLVGDEGEVLADLVHILGQPVENGLVLGLL